MMSEDLNYIAVEVWNQTCMNLYRRTIQAVGRDRSQINMFCVCSELASISVNLLSTNHLTFYATKPQNFRISVHYSQTYNQLTVSSRGL
jgi:hypothetical protein